MQSCSFTRNRDYITPLEASVANGCAKLAGNEGSRNGYVLTGYAYKIPIQQR